MIQYSLSTYNIISFLVAKLYMKKERVMCFIMSRWKLQLQSDFLTRGDLANRKTDVWFNLRNIKMTVLDC